MQRGSTLGAWLWLFFLVSGLCSLVYQVVALRLAMAHFGVTAPMTSIVLSVFMAGLALGSVGAGRLAGWLGDRPALLLRCYALSELFIALWATAVPQILAAGRRSIASGDGAEWGSGAHYLVAGGWVTSALLPFCICMGATLPLAMGVVRRLLPQAASRSFSGLYTANVLGAAAGTLASAFVMIELLGFKGTLELAAGLNATLAAGALLLSLRVPDRPAAGPTDEAATSLGPPPEPGARAFALFALAASGLVSMAAEVVWVRQFTPYLGTVVYSFASILAVYLVATFLGSSAYRVRAARGSGQGGFWPGAWLLLCLGSLLPLLAADPTLGPAWLGASALLRTILGLGAFCFATGYLTPLLVDHYSQGDPERAGAAYAVNVIGCIVGPLLAGFWLLPSLGERSTLLALAALCFLTSALALLGPLRGLAGRREAWARPALAAGLVVAIPLHALTQDFETRFVPRVVRRDYAATSTAIGEGMERKLLVNGIAMSNLTTITKMMAHLPLAFLDRQPESVLVICFGMGTSFRSAMAWGGRTTAVELIPGVPSLFGYFHDDADELLRSPRARIVIDDGRRLLERSPERYDAILIDPPPPVQAAGSSLLYSVEFYDAARRRLRPGGILQQWLPEGDALTRAAFSGALVRSFPHVRAFGSVEGWGIHFLASAQPIALRSPDELAARLPEAAARDLLEWVPGHKARDAFDVVLRNEVPVALIAAQAPGARALTDDRPVNEYDFLRARLRSRRVAGGRPL